MRILVLNQYFRPDQSASAQRISDLVEDLAGHHEVTVIAGRPSYGLMDDAHGERVAGAAGVRVRYVPSTAFRRDRAWQRIVNYLTYLVGALVTGVFAARHDVVMAATDPPLVSVIGLWISRIHRAPFVHLLWDVQPEIAIAAGLLRPGMMARAMSALNRRAMRQAACVITPTSEMSRTAVELGVPPDRVHTIPHWEDLDIVGVLPKDNAFSRRHALVDRFVVMYAGNIGLTQELHRYVDLADRMRDLPDVTFVFVGNGAGTTLLKARAAALTLTSVRFLPFAPRAEMAQSLATADVFLAPLAAGLTRYMLPSKIYTIMASGRPVIAALDLTSDLAPMIRAAQCGFVVSPGDLDATEQHLRWLYANADARREMGRQGRAVAEARYARTVVTPQFNTLLTQLKAMPLAAMQHVR